MLKEAQELTFSKEFWKTYTKQTLRKMFRRQFQDQLMANLYLKGEKKKIAQITLVHITNLDSYMEIPSKEKCNTFQFILFITSFLPATQLA
jgi:hypothetical protein